MDQMVERWRNTLKSSQRKSQHTSSEKPVDLPVPTLPPPLNMSSSSKKSAKKKKNQDSQSPPRATKSAHVDATYSQLSPKNRIISQFTNRILSVKGSDSRKHIQFILQQLWSAAESLAEPQSLSQNRDLLSSKIQSKIHSDLQSKYFSLQKQKQALKLQMEEMIKRHQGVEKQNVRLLKVQKLVDNCIKREETMNKDIDFLRAQLKGAEEREKEQQKVFKKEVMAIHGLIEAIKESLPE